MQSLIVPAVEYQPAQALPLAARRRPIYPIRFGRLIEQQPDWVWTAIEPLQPAAAAALGRRVIGAPPVPPAAANE